MATMPEDRAGRIPAVVAEKPHKGLSRLACSDGCSGLLVVAGHVEEKSCCCILAIGLTILQQLHSMWHNLMHQHDGLPTCRSEFISAFMEYLPAFFILQQPQY